MIQRMLLVLAGIGLSLSLAAAQPEPAPAPQAGPPGPGLGKMHRQMMAKLNLTDQQKTQVEKLRADFEKKSIDTQAKIRTLQVDLRTAALADNPDKGAIQKIVGSISDLQNRQKMELIDHLFAVRSVLTPEQQKVWKSELMQIGAGMREGGPMRMRQGAKMQRHPDR